MSMTSAEKQRRFRQRHLKDGERERLNLIVVGNAKRALERLARHHDLSQGNMLGLLLMRTERETLRGLEDAAQYYGGAAHDRTAVT